MDQWLYGLAEAYGQQCQIVSWTYLVSDRDMVELPMVIMDMPTSAADQDMEIIVVIATESDLHLDHCVFPCHRVTTIVHATTSTIVVSSVIVVAVMTC